MLVLQQEQRQLLAETVRDIANVGAGAMIFGHFLTEREFSASVAVGGVMVWFGLVGWALLLAREKKS